MTALRERVARELSASRARVEALTSLDDAELVAQHSALMSPLVWDLAHVVNYEEIWLAREAAGLPAYRPELDDLYDAFAHPRAERPALPILAPPEARHYGKLVRERAWQSVERLDVAGAAAGNPLLADGFVHGMVVQHEQQHAETMLATHQLRAGPPVLAETTLPLPGGERAGTAGVADVLVEAGPYRQGTSSDPWALDNERPAHVVDVPSFRIDVHPVSNSAFAGFVAAGGYADPRWWSAPGWSHRQAEQLGAPAFWEPDGSWFTRRRFGRVEDLPPEEPVQHVTFHEAAAYARWAGRRLPTESEWEKACRYDPATGQVNRFPWGDEDPNPDLANLAYEPDAPSLRPAPIGSYPGGASPCGAQQMIGDVWEWTSSPFAGYPGFRAWPYPEYSEVFFGNEYRVLRGGSWASHPVAVRGTFRNWDYPIRRQIFAGFRTAISLDPERAPTSRDFTADPAGGS